MPHSPSPGTPHLPQTAITTVRHCPTALQTFANLSPSTMGPSFTDHTCWCHPRLALSGRDQQGANLSMMLAWCQCVWGSRGEVDSTVLAAAPKRAVKWASNQRMNAWQLLGACDAWTQRWMQELRPWGCCHGPNVATAARMQLC